MESRVPEPEEVLAQARWVARLAYALTGDRSHGDDLTQETLVAGIERPPRIAGLADLRAWLAVVLRNRVITERAQASTRRWRERDVARDELAPSPEEILALEEARTALVQRVLALPEDQRTVLLLRYFEQLSATEIARRLGLPASTVRGRVERGLGNLRRQLETQSGDWRRGVLALVPAGFRPIPTVMMMAKTKLVVGAALVAAGLWWAVGLDLTDRGPVLEGGTSTAPDRETQEVTLAGGEDTPAAQPEASGPRQGAARASISTGFAELVFGSVRSRSGEALDSGSIALVGPLGLRHRTSLDERSAFSFHGLEPGTYQLQAWCRGFLPSIGARIEVVASGEPQRHDLVLDASWSVPVRMVDGSGDLLLTGPKSSAPARVGLTVVATLEAPGADLPLSTGAFGGWGRYRGHSIFQDEDEDLPDDATGVLEVLHAGPVYVSLVLRSVVLQTELVQPGASAVIFQVPGDPIAERLATVTVRVISDQTGAPIEGARVSLSTRSTGGGGASTDAAGYVTLERVLPGLMELEVSGEGHERFRDLVQVTPGSEQDLGEFRLRAASGVGIQVLNEGGEPIPGLTLGIAPLHLVDCAAAFRLRRSAETDEDGRVRLRIAEGSTLLYPLSTDWAANGDLVELRAASKEQLVVTLARGQRFAFDFVGAGPLRPALEYLVRTPEGVPVAGDNVRSGPCAANLLHGRYQLELWSGPDLVSTLDFEVDEATRRVRVGY